MSFAPRVSRPKAAATRPPAAITMATKVIDQVVLPVASFRWPKMYGPAIAAALPTPSIRPKALERPDRRRVARELRERAQGQEQVDVDAEALLRLEHKRKPQEEPVVGDV